MKAAYVGSDESLANPLDLMEQVASAHDWLFERSSKSDLSLEIVGQWCDYRMFLSWHPEVSALLFVCAYDMRVPDSRWTAVAELLASINEKMLIGHFDLWSGDSLPVFRHSTLLRGMPGASVEQLEDLVHIARAECERYYPAFQFVIWGGKTPGEAISAAMLETMGEA